MQKRAALQKLNEQNSPFVPTKTQQIFQNSANLQLRGNTFDASHLDKFLQSDYGERGLGTGTYSVDGTSKAAPATATFQQTAGEQGSQMQQNTNLVTGDSIYEQASMEERDANSTMMQQHKTAHSSAPSYVVNSQVIKPSVSFMNLSRDQAKIKHYVDLMDGPSSLQKRENVPTMRDKKSGE